MLQRCDLFNCKAWPEMHIWWQVLPGRTRMHWHCLSKQPCAEPRAVIMLLNKTAPVSA